MNFMKRKTRTPLPGMAEGQMWNVDHACLHIVELGRHLAHFRILTAPDQTAVLSRSIRVDALAVYLRASEATLMNQSPIPQPIPLRSVASN